MKIGVEIVKVVPIDELDKILNLIEDDRPTEDEIEKLINKKNK